MVWTVLSIICIVMLICIAAVLLESHRECKRLRLTKYMIESEQLPADFDGYRIVILADLHNTAYPGGGQGIIEFVQEQKPDIVLLAGDMIVCRSDMRDANMKTGVFIRELAARVECYYGFGNHETGISAGVRGVGSMWREYLDILNQGREKAVRLLDNETVELVRGNSAIRITGLNLDMSYYKRIMAKKLGKDALESMLGAASCSAYNILIAHNPEYFDTYAAWGADLVVSGHNHGGLVRIPGLGGVISPRLRIFPKYDYGVYHKGNSTMILSGGMGAHSLKIRVNNRPELILAELHKKYG